MLVQNNSGSQWSGNFSQPPSAIVNEDLNTQDLISKQNVRNKKEQLQDNQSKHLTIRWIKLKYTLWFNINNKYLKIGTYLGIITTQVHQVNSDSHQTKLPGCCQISTLIG